MKRMTQKIRLSVVAALFIIAPSPVAFAHCEIPCGIYGDAMRIDMIEENCQTIEKSMTEIRKLSIEDDKNYNQLVRWVNNKEEHANKIQHIVTQYFLFQRIKPVNSDNAEGHEAYQEKLVVLHKILVHAMKCKQTVDAKQVEKIRVLLDSFKRIYFGEGGVAHLERHHASSP